MLIRFNRINLFVVFGVLLLSLLSASGASAETWRYSATIDATDPSTTTTGHCFLGHAETYSFNVTTSGIYRFEIASHDFIDNIDYYAYSYVWISSTPSIDNYVTYSYYRIDGLASYGSAFLNAGQMYYLIFSDCYFIAMGMYTSVTIDLTIFGYSSTLINHDDVLPPDNRINWQYGDSNTVIYEHEDGVVIYCYNGDTWLGMLINQEVVNNWNTNLPQETPVLEVNDDGCHAAFYILDSGEYQINIWSYEGKLYEIIADNLNFRDATMRYHDPNE